MEVSTSLGGHRLFLLLMVKSGSWRQMLPLLFQLYGSEAQPQSKGWFTALDGTPVNRYDPTPDCEPKCRIRAEVRVAVVAHSPSKHQPDSF